LDILSNLKKRKKIIMKKFMIMSVLVALTVSGVFANATNDIANVRSLYTDKQFEECKAAAEKMLVDYPGDEKASFGAASMIGNCLRSTRQFDEAIVAYNNANNDYEYSMVGEFINQCYIGHCYCSIKQYANAQSAWETALIKYPTVPNSRKSNAMLYVIKMMAKQGLPTSKEYVKAASDYGFISLDYQIKCFENIKFQELGMDASVKYLQNVLLTTPAIDANAEFLGRVKSQLEVLK
jgi:tetratricopeptide (TPR) repeat protein